MIVLAEVTRDPNGALAGADPIGQGTTMLPMQHQIAGA